MTNRYRSQWARALSQIGPGERITHRVAKYLSEAVAGPLLAEHGVTEQTIEDPPVEDVIEQVFASGALAR